MTRTNIIGQAWLTVDNAGYGSANKVRNAKFFEYSGDNQRDANRIRQWIIQ